MSPSLFTPTLHRRGLGLLSHARTVAASPSRAARRAGAADDAVMLDALDTKLFSDTDDGASPADSVPLASLNVDTDGEAPAPTSAPASASFLAAREHWAGLSPSLPPPPSSPARDLAPRTPTPR
jgi:hypothetical protein